MRFLNEVRLFRLRGPAGSTIELREHVLGVDASTHAHARGFVAERHRPLLVRVAAAGAPPHEVAISSSGRAAAMLPFMIAPAVALVVRLAIRTGRR